MPVTRDTPPSAKRRRADAERSVARILDAALEALAIDPEVSMAGIARQAGLVRATIYVHFPTRESLIEAVTDRAITEVAAKVAAAEPQRGDAVEALERVVAAAWSALGRFHALVALNARLPHADSQRRHLPVLDLLTPLIERGQREGSFRSDVGVGWHLTMLMAIVHAASGQANGPNPPQELEAAVVATVLGAIRA